MTWVRSHAKALVPAVATLLGVVTLAVITGEVDQEELFAAISGLLVAAGVWRVPNQDGYSVIELAVGLVVFLILVLVAVRLADGAC